LVAEQLPHEFPVPAILFEAPLEPFEKEENREKTLLASP